MSTNPSVFISYSHVDTPIIEPIEKALKAAGIDVWRDPRLHVGQEWWREILQEIDRNQIFVVAISNESTRSRFCKAELREAFRLKKPIIPLVVRDRARVPKLIGHRQHLTILKNEKTKIKQLIDAVLQEPIPLVKPEPTHFRPTPYPSWYNEFWRLFRKALPILMALLIIILMLVGLFLLLTSDKVERASRKTPSVAHPPTELITPSPTLAPTPTQNLLCTNPPTAVPRIVVADFDTNIAATAPSEDFFDELNNALTTALGDIAQICRLSKAIRLAQEADEEATHHEALVFIWGEINDTAFNVYIRVKEVPNYKVPGDIASDGYTFRLRRIEHVQFLTQFVLSQIYYFSGQPLMARRILEQALQDTEDDLDGDWKEEESLKTQWRRDIAEAYFVLGFLYDSLSGAPPNLNKAITNYAIAFEYNPQSPYPQLNLANALAQQGDRDAALDSLNKLIQEQPTFTPAYLARALVQPTQVLAEDDFAKAIELAPDEGYLNYLNRAYSRLGWENYPGAIRDFEMAMKYTTDDAEQLNMLNEIAQAQLLLNKPDAAIQTYQSIMPQVDEDTLDLFVASLKELIVGEQPLELRHAVQNIIKLLRMSWHAQHRD